MGYTTIAKTVFLQDEQLAFEEVAKPLAAHLRKRCPPVPQLSRTVPDLRRTASCAYVPHAKPKLFIRNLKVSAVKTLPTLQQNFFLVRGC